MGEESKIQKQLDSFNRVKKTILAEIGKEAKDFFVSGFEKQGFTNTNFEAWKEDKNSKGKILERTGNLKNSIKVSEITENSVTVSTDVPYAKYVNDGREFMGISETLSKNTQKIIDENIKKIF
jgi:phage gpG-like protein